MSEIFARFEVNREPRWPVLLRLLVASFIFHMAALASLMYVPAVRDTFNIVSLLSDTSFVDKPYVKTQIGDDVQVLHLAKFHYPEGYFAMAAGMTAVPEPTPLPWASNANSGFKPKTPEAEPSPSPTPSPSPADVSNSNTDSAEASPSVDAEANANTNSNANANAQANANQTEQEKEKAQAEKAQEQLEKTAAANGVDLPVDNEINRQPLKDLASYANLLKKDGKLDLDQSFEVVVEAELDETAKLQKPTFVQKSGDPALIDLAGRTVGALNDSRLLVLLKTLNEGKPTKLVFIIRQNQTELVARIESDVSSEDTARQKARVFNMMLAAGEKARQGKDEAVLMRNTAASAEGKKVVFSFSMPRQAVGEMIKKQIASNANTKQG